MHFLTYPLEENQFVNRWLVSEPHTVRVNGKPRSIVQDVNVWEGSVASSSHQNPIRQEFVEKRRTEVDSIPSFPLKEVEGQVLIQKVVYPLHAHFPFHDPVVSLSGFWPSPTWIGACAYTLVESPDRVAIPCEFGVCGGADLWVNGTLAIKFAPYERNVMQKREFLLDLKAGVNELVIAWDDFAERDSECSFSLGLLSPQSSLSQKLPIGNREEAKIKKVEQALGNLAFVRNHQQSGEVLLTCPNPYADKDFVIDLEGATEENFMVGVLYSTQAIFPKGSDTASLGPCEKLPLGFLQFATKTTVEGMDIFYAITVENYPLSVLPPLLPTVRERKQQAFSFLAKYGEQNGNRAVALLHENGDEQEFATILTRQIEFINRRSDCSDFYLSYFPYMLRTYATSTMLTPQLKEAMKQCILNFRYWHDEPGDDVMWFYSENHALMFHVCQLISGELYPGEVFTNSGMTGRQMQEKAISLLEPWFETFFREGFTEWNSPPYLPIDTLGFASLYAQTKNPRMKELGKKALDYVFHLLAVYSLDGIFCTTAGRTYLKELFANNANCPSFINYIGYGLGNVSHAGKGVVALAFSDYEPPEAYKVFCTVGEGKALVCQSTHGYHGYANVYAYKTQRYILSSANDFRVGERGFQENPIHLLMTPTAQLWISHPGELALFGHARPSYWAGNGSLPRVNQYKGFATIQYAIGEDHPVGFTHLYFPTMEFLAWRKQGNWIFGEAPNHGYVGVYSSNGLSLQKEGPNKDRECISQGRKVLWLIRAASKSSFGSFENFIQTILDSPFAVEDWHYSFTDCHLGVLCGSWTEGLSVDGYPVTYNGFDPVGTTLWCNEE